MEPSPRGVSESSESVRSKLRDSLAAALALVSPPHDKLSVCSDVQHNEHVKVQVPFNTEAVQSNFPTLVSEGTSVERPAEFSNGELQALHQKLDDQKTLMQENKINEVHNPLKVSDINGQEFLMVPVPCNGSMSNIYSSETDRGDLKVNYPSCESLPNDDLDIHRESKRSKLKHDDITGDITESVVQCPRMLAVTIEGELFKLFGGVNKKYKEKARSLLFNLKDRNNPDLRERVMSGAIAPDRLCCMTAEELASKELSQWRIAKAEELAQMVVLPDAEVDIRRIVRKTHKGEFQVEVEQDDIMSVEVAIGGGVSSQVSRSTKSTEKVEHLKSNGPEKSEGTIGEEKTDSKDDTSDLPSTKKHTDFIEFTVEELRNTEFLPPIVSLDDFMGSLESEPFETLQLHNEESIPNPDGKKSSNSLGPQSNDLDSQLKNVGHSELDKPESNDTRVKGRDTFEHGEEPKLLGENPIVVPHSDQIWEGFIQLNISATANVSAFFKSGEKTMTEDWPSFLEIKGRVRVDAFEKFLQELQHSRSRAIMVALFCWKEGSSENGLMKLQEVSESYVVDERVGFAEPAPGVELYLCPLHPKWTEMLGKHVPREYLNPLKDIADGLIGIVVWRKIFVTTSPPKSTSHNLQRQSSKRHASSRRHDVGLRTPGNAQNLSQNLIPTASAIEDDGDEIDDIPPGFGPAAAAASPDVDDLPEFFDFSSRSIAAAGSAAAPVLARAGPPRMHIAAEQMRGPLIHNHGQGGSTSLNFSATTGSRNPPPVSGCRVEVQPWNDEDDIPEWRPQTNGGLQFRPMQSMQGHQLQPQHLQMPPAPPPLAPVLFRPPSQLLPPQMAGTIQGHRIPSPWQVGEAQAPHGFYNPVSGTLPTPGVVVPPCSYGRPSVGSTFYTRPNFCSGQNGGDWRP